MISDSGKRQAGRFSARRTPLSKSGSRPAGSDGALALAIKAKLEAVESGIATFEEEFLAYVVLPDGQSVGQHVLPNIEQAYVTNKMPPLLPVIGGTGEGK
jgi:hypothetical protein